MLLQSTLGTQQSKIKESLRFLLVMRKGGGGNP